jgi:hypothetical protein
MLGWVALWTLISHLNHFKKMILQVAAEHLPIQFGVINNQNSSETMPRIGRGGNMNKGTVMKLTERRG